MKFYRFVHFYDEPEGEGAEEKMKELLKSGVRSIDFDLSRHIKWAEENKHPRLKDVKRYAKEIGTPVEK